MRIAAALVAALVACAVQAADGFPAILERTSAYVAKFEQEFASIIWHETYEQIDRLPRTFGASGGRFAGVTRRHLESEMLFIMAVSFGPPARAGAGALPDSLSTSAFWALSTELSEPNGYFQSDNLVSNEIQFQRVIPDLTKSARAGRVYLGVGPEQNFSYIAALKPSMVFIVDVRRGNLQLHLMYKALFELSTDRADFVSRLFSKKRPASLTAASTAQDIFAAYEKVETDDENLYKANLTAIDDHLVKTRGLQLTEEDLKGIEYVYYQFFNYGPSIQYWSTGGSGRGGRTAPTFADLMAGCSFVRALFPQGVHHLCGAQATTH